MSISNRPERLFEAVRSRHRALRVAGVVSTALGVLVGAFVGYDWFVHRVSHEIMALAAAAAILLGVQLLVLSTLTGMLILLHREHVSRVERFRE